MPRFIGLSEAIQHQISQALSQMPTAPAASPVAVQLGNNELSASPVGVVELGVLRWGFSTWGVEPVTSEYKPGITLPS